MFHCHASPVEVYMLSLLTICSCPTNSSSSSSRSPSHLYFSEVSSLPSGPDDSLSTL